MTLRDLLWRQTVDRQVAEYDDSDQFMSQAQRNRAYAYRYEADPLFFAWQRGEGEEQAWLDKVAEIRERFPYAG